MVWQPTIIRRFSRALPTSARTAVVVTDAGTGYLKAMGGPEGLHTLACDLVGTRLANWLGLSTLDLAILDVAENDEIPFIDSKGNIEGFALSGPAFITREVKGDAWSGNAKQLEKLSNPEDISRLVVFDTWTLNCDRFGPRSDDPLAKARINRQNVLLSEEGLPGKLLLKAIDHTHCFTCGRSLTKGVNGLDNIRDQRVFGRFPEFVPFLDRKMVQEAARLLGTIDRAMVEPMLSDIPVQWEVKSEVKGSWIELILNRARFVSETIERKLWPQQDIDFVEDKEPQR